jgi:hypothetical protein
VKKFKVVEIVDATTIRVNPTWTVKKSDGSSVVGDLIMVSGLPEIPNDQAVKRRLTIVLLNKDIEAYNPIFTTNKLAPIECSIYIAKKDVVYFFPELCPA